MAKLKPPLRAVQFGDSGEDVENLYEYLKRFGYFPNEELSQIDGWQPLLDKAPSDTLVFDSVLQDALRLFQRNHGLMVSGRLDSDTLELMQIPRCGCPDPKPDLTTVPDVGYVLSGRKWGKDHLTYSFDNFCEEMTEAQCHVGLEFAFENWSRTSAISFERQDSEGDIAIGWYKGVHATGTPFDGPGGILAHAYYPQNGDIHFDDDESWTLEMRATMLRHIDLLTVALHEIGHSLGLSHSPVASAVMYAYYKGSKRELTSDDVEGIQKLYGSPWWHSLGGSIAGDVVATTTHDDRVMVFARGSGDDLCFIEQGDDDAWGSWVSLGGLEKFQTKIASKAALELNEDGRLAAFVCGEDGAVYQTWQQSQGGDWSAWASQGNNNFVGSPAVGRNKDGRLEIFAQSKSGELLAKWQSTPGGKWSDWVTMGGVSHNPVASMNQDDCLEVFTLANIGSLWHRWQTKPNNGWGSWSNLRGRSMGTVSVVRNLDGRLEVFAQGRDGSLWQRWERRDRTWGGWESRGGRISSPTAYRDSLGRLVVFCKGLEDNLVWYVRQVRRDDGWEKHWRCLGGETHEAPGVRITRDGRLIVATKRADGALWVTTQRSPGSDDWE